MHEKRTTIPEFRLEWNEHLQTSRIFATLMRFIQQPHVLESDMPTRLQLAAFDLDGVLADTEPLHKKAKLRIFRELGLKNSMDLDEHIGKPNSVLWLSIIKENNLDSTPREFERMQYDYILEQMRDDAIPLSDGLLDLLDAFERLGVCLGVCSSSDRHYVDRALAFYGLTERFRHIVAGDQVPEKKPAPDGYRKLSTTAPAYQRKYRKWITWVYFFAIDGNPSRC